MRDILSRVIEACLSAVAILLTIYSAIYIADHIIYAIQTFGER